jgi:hypothetical protein
MSHVIKLRAAFTNSIFLSRRRQHLIGSDCGAHRCVHLTLGHCELPEPQQPWYRQSLDPLCSGSDNEGESVPGISDIVWPPHISSYIRRVRLELSDVGISQRRWSCLRSVLEASETH